MHLSWSQVAASMCLLCSCFYVSSMCFLFNCLLCGYRLGTRIKKNHLQIAKNWQKRCKSTRRLEALGRMTSKRFGWLIWCAHRFGNLTWKSHMKHGVWNTLTKHCRKLSNSTRNTPDAMAHVLLLASWTKRTSSRELLLQNLQAHEHFAETWTPQLGL